MKKDKLESLKLGFDIEKAEREARKGALWKAAKECGLALLVGILLSAGLWWQMLSEWFGWAP